MPKIIGRARVCADRSPEPTSGRSPAATPVLRQGRRRGLRFRRQVPIGNYIADFACFSPKLIVEADGEWFHRDREYDKRDAWFESQGFMVIRFKNKDVIGGQAHVAAVILARTGRA
jgi:very-short-patch-repair endonuclease